MTYKVSSGTLNLCSLTHLLVNFDKSPEVKPGNLSKSGSRINTNSFTYMQVRPILWVYKRRALKFLLAILVIIMTTSLKVSTYRIHISPALNMHETRTIAVDDPVAWCVCQSVCHAVNCSYSFSRWRHFDAAIITLR